MSSIIASYFDGENTPISSSNGPIKSVKAPMAKRSMKSEPRSFFGDVSNRKWSRGGHENSGRRGGATDKVPNRSRNDEDQLLSPVVNLFKKLKDTKTIEKKKKEEEEIGTVPPNDDLDLPDDFDDIWPIAERPTRNELKWLITWDVRTTESGRGILFEREEETTAENDVVPSWDLEEAVLEPLQEEDEELPEMEMEHFDEDLVPIEF